MPRPTYDVPAMAHLTAYNASALVDSIEPVTVGDRCLKAVLEKGAVVKRAVRGAWVETQECFVVFQGGRFGEHRLSTFSSDAARVLAH